MKIFILWECGGGYDDYYSNVIGVFSSEELANKEKIRIENFYSEWLNAPDPFPDYKYDSDSEFEAHNKWYNNHSSAKDFRSCDIKEAELDSILIDVLTQQ
jgi:hypothetical protein